MRISCMQESLARGLATVSRAVATHSSLPILSNVLLASDKGRLKLSATNLELGINCWIGAQVEQDGQITVPARILADLVNSLPPERVDLQLVVRTNTLNLKCGRLEANIKGLDAQEFPLIIIPDDEKPLLLKAGMLAQMIDQVAFAAAQDDNRPVLTGVLADLSADTLTFAAADGYRLSVRKEPVEGVAWQSSVVIPAKALQELRRLSADADAPVSMLISRNRNQVFFHLDEIDLVSQLVEGSFPDYNAIVPTSYNTKTTLLTADLLSAIRMAYPFARDASNMVRLQIVPGGAEAVGKVVITASSPDHGDIVSELEATIEGTPVEIAFNARYLIDILSVVNTPQVTLTTRDPSSPGVFRPDNGPALEHVVMPMHIGR
ncbi:MAG: DNA polymerase III subunit beta [Chloroflexi bacterium]|nr:DNA polymerase III subunit beta [Chloroflexota bacterium]